MLLFPLWLVENLLAGVAVFGGGEVEMLRAGEVTFYSVTDLG